MDAQFRVVSDAADKKPSGEAQSAKKAVDALTIIAKKLETLLDRAVSNAGKHAVTKDVADTTGGGETKESESDELAQATEVVVDLVAFLVKFAQAPVGNNLSLIAKGGQAGESGQNDAPPATDGKLLVDKIGPLMSQLQKALDLLSKANVFASQDFTKLGPSLPLASGSDVTPNGVINLGAENPLRAVLGAVKLLEAIVGQQSGKPKLVESPISQNLSIVGGGSKDTSNVEPDILVASNRPFPPGKLLLSSENFGLLGAMAAKPILAKQGRDAFGPQVNIEKTKKAHAAGGSPSKVLDSRVLNVLSFVAGKASAISENGGQGLLLAGFENPGSKENPVTFSASNFSPLISEREFAMALNASDRTAAVSVNRSVEKSQGSRFASAIAKQIQSATFGTDRTVIQLSPNGLGNIEIEIKTDDDGVLKIVLRAENMLVLNTLRQDRDTVLQALSMANLDSHTTSLEFQEFDKQPQSQGSSNVESTKFKSGQDGADEGQPAGYTPLISRDQLDILA